MGNLVADAILWMTAAEGTQIAIINGGSIRSSIAAGEVALGDVLEVLPFSNTIATFELTGADIRAALENGVSRANSAQNEGTGRFPQVAGLRYTWNPDSQPGSRIAGVEVRNPDGSYSPIDPEKTYLVATNDFLRRGGDGYTPFAEKAINPYDAGANLEEAVALYIAAHSPVVSEVEGRIVQTRTQQNPIFSLALLLLASGFGIAGITVLVRRQEKPAV
jgi:5'-nucleotidase